MVLSLNKINNSFCETCEFGPCWTKNNKVTPSETAKNRKFIINFPNYTKNLPSSGKEIKVNKKDEKIDWANITSYVDLTEFGIKGTYKGVQTERGFIKLEPNKIFEIRKMSNNSIPVIEGLGIKGSSSGNGKISENSFILKRGGGLI